MHHLTSEEINRYAESFTTGESELLYLHTAPYSPEFEGGVRYDDPSLNIVWPMPAIGVSERDSGLPLWNTGKKEFLQ